MNVNGFAQEFWVGNDELVDMYEKRLGDAGYINFKLARTNNRGDGIVFFPYLFKKLYKSHGLSISPFLIMWICQITISNAPL